MIIDYPREEEVITSADYTFRFCAPDETAKVEVSLDGGPWRECRRAHGYFWFDWSHYRRGEHLLGVRRWCAGGSLWDAGIRRLRVELDESA
jgi:hypothetical protein